MDKKGKGKRKKKIVMVVDREVVRDKLRFCSCPTHSSGTFIYTIACNTQG